MSTSADPGIANLPGQVITHCARCGFEHVGATNKSGGACARWNWVSSCYNGKHGECKGSYNKDTKQHSCQCDCHKPEAPEITDEELGLAIKKAHALVAELQDIDLNIRILVCGDRNWSDRQIIHTMLQGFLGKAVEQFGNLVIIDGCARGADSFACHFFDGKTHAAHESIEHEHFPADWEVHGRAAGPIRNRQMLKAKPGLVLAFHDDLENSKGTKDMVNLAKSAAIPTYVIRHA